MKRLFGWDPERRVKEVFHHDEADDHFYVETIQDVEPVIEANKQLYNQFDSHRDRFGEDIGARTLVARVPDVIIAELKKRGIWQDKAKLAAWLDTSEAAPWRTRPGRVA